jgi:hypothetical protein
MFVHQAEAEQLRAAAERALSDVKIGARAAISDMAQRHEQDLLAARAAAAEEVRGVTHMSNGCNRCIL